MFEFRASRPFKPGPFLILEQLSSVFLGCSFTDIILKADRPKIRNKTVKDAFFLCSIPPVAYSGVSSCI